MVRIDLSVGLSWMVRIRVADVPTLNFFKGTKRVKRQARKTWDGWQQATMEVISSDAMFAKNRTKVHLHLDVCINPGQLFLSAFEQNGGTFP